VWGDGESVMLGGPWSFRENTVLIEEYDGFTKPSSIELFHLGICIQNHDLPIGFALMMKSLAYKVGKLISSKGLSGDYEGSLIG
jgi:hypothetical protein